MHTYANSGLKDAPLIVEDLLKELHDRYEETRDPHLRPNSRSFNTFLNAWAKSNLPGSVERIKDWIDQMHLDYENGKSRIRPNKWAYSVSFEKDDLFWLESSTSWTILTQALWNISH